VFDLHVTFEWVGFKKKGSGWKVVELNAFYFYLFVVED
jgi:hypothetical protein|tara:strand:+ start:2379 stop:2492 length:114 start_codon:yes stop_codon:yes gene_type:complete